MKRALVVTATLLISSAAYAGPPVTVTIKNLSTTTAATFSMTNNNEISTHANSTPKPPTSIPANTTAAPFMVQSTITPSANYAQLRYKVGSKTCVFYTALVDNTPTGGVPQWTKTATPSGGAVCTATITAIDNSPAPNPNRFAWSVEFTIK